MTQSKKIAVTGGIGSGKTAFCEILRRRGYPVFSCDEISAELWREAAYRARLAEAFPDCRSDGAIDKGKLTERVFADENARRRLNEISHPAIMERLMAKMTEAPVSFGEVPLLYEEGLEGEFDGVIALRRPLDARIASVCARDELSAEEVAARVAAQFDEANLDGKDCFLIENDGTLCSLEERAEEALAYFGIA